MKNKIEVCIIMLNWNGKGLTQNALDLVKKYTRGISYKVVLVDSASIDGSVEFFEKNYRWIDLIKLKQNKGFSGGNNIAIKYAYKKYNPEYYYFLSNDTKVTKGWLSECLGFAKKHPEGGMFGSRQFDFNGNQAKYAGYMSSLGVHRYISPVESIKVEWISGAAFLTKKEVIEKTGAFDEIFNPAYYEETDWEKRTLDSGFIIYTVPSSIVYHKGAGSESSYNFNKQDLYYRNRAIFYMRHYKQYLLGRFILDVYKGIKNKMVGRIFASYINGIKAYSGSYGRIRTVRIGN